MDVTKLVLVVLLAAAVGVAVYFAYRAPPSRVGGTRGPFGQGRDLVTAGDYDTALAFLEEYLQRYPQGRNASRARFFIAKAHIGRKDLSAARAAFEAVLRIHPDSLEAHKSRYKLAVVDLWEGHTAKARKRFQALAIEPDGPLTPEAAAMTAFLAGRGRMLIEAEAGEVE